MDLFNAAQVLAGTAWGEARNLNVAGMQSVINVVMNRVHHPRWWGSTVLSVCLKMDQFSCWNHDDPNREKILSVTEADPEYMVALALAKYALMGRLSDITGGADSYYSLTMRKAPSWAARAVFTTVIGNQKFFKVELA